MKFVLLCTNVCLISLSLVQSFDKQVFHQFDLNNYLYNNVQFRKSVNDSKVLLVKNALAVDPLLHDYKIVKYKQNIFKALRKLTQSWKLVPRRSGRQEEAAALGEVISSSEQTIASIGAGFKIADTVIHSLVTILRTVFGGIVPDKTPPKLTNTNVAAAGQGTDPILPKTTTEKYFRDYRSRSLNSEHKYLHNFADSLRDNSYSDQLSGVLSILAEQNGSSRVKRETIKSTVDYILDVYVATNGNNTQALFLPQLFEGIPKNT